MDWNYYNTFITVAADCPVRAAEMPAAAARPSVPRLQYELLAAAPYHYTQQELFFEVHVRRMGLSDEERAARRDAIWDELFNKPMACLRASMLPKRYGWGLHFDRDGRVALVPMESDDYRRLAAGGEPAVKVLAAMRNRRA